MRLLILTQILDVNDPNLGFFHDWIIEFSKKCDKLYIICLKKGEYHLPENVEVFSLGKEDGVSRIKYVFRFYKYIFLFMNKYDNVFVHMSQIYVVIGALFWRMFGKKVGFWYAHGAVGWILRLAEKATNIVFTSTEYGFNIKSKKIRIVGQGINPKKFPSEVRDLHRNALSITSIGRISKSKKLESFINIAEKLLENNINFTIKLFGQCISQGDQEYRNGLQALIQEKKLTSKILFCGELKPESVPAELNKSDIFISFSDTKSLDKALIEALMSGKIVLTTNISFRNLDFIKTNYPVLVCSDYSGLETSLISIIQMDSQEIISLENSLAKFSKAEYDLSGLVDKILAYYEKKVI